MKRCILIFIFFCSILIFPQSGKLVGKVTESITGKPLLGVNISLKETKKGAATIGEGEYAILKIPAGKYQVNFSCRGYEMRTVSEVSIKEGKATTLNMELKAVNMKLETGTQFDPDTDMNADLEKEYLNTIPENIRKLIKEIKPLDRHVYFNVLTQSYLNIKSRSSSQVHLYILREIDQKIDYLRVMEFDVMSELLGAKYRKSSNAEEKNVIKSKLRTVLKDLFQARQEETRIRLSIMEEEINSAKKSLNKWVKEENKLLQERLKNLTE